LEQGEAAGLFGRKERQKEGADFGSPHRDDKWESLL